VALESGERLFCRVRSDGTSRPPEVAVEEQILILAGDRWTRTVAQSPDKGRLFFGPPEDDLHAGFDGAG